MAYLFFQLISCCYQRGSLLITFNRPSWSGGEVFGDQVLATAILDRLLHHTHPNPVAEGRPENGEPWRQEVGEPVLLKLLLQPLQVAVELAGAIGRAVRLPLPQGQVTVHRVTRDAQLRRDPPSAPASLQ